MVLLIVGVGRSLGRDYIIGGIVKERPLDDTEVMIFFFIFYFLCQI